MFKYQIWILKLDKQRDSHLLFGSFRKLHQKLRVCEYLCYFDYLILAAGISLQFIDDSLKCIHL